MTSHDVATARVTSGALRRHLDGDHVGIRDRVRREVLANPDLALPPPDLPTADHRALVLSWAEAMAATGATGLGFPTEFGGGGDVEGSVVAFEMLGHGDLSLLVKCGVQFGLFGGAVLHLGTRRHHERYLPDIISLRLPGCFAMTEVGHGSNVQALETTATYDAGTSEFIVHTPTPSATKDWIGNAAQHGRMAAVFTQLLIDGTSQGVHALLVPIRDEAGQPLPGVTIQDCGEKLGLNGVDNGRLAFDQVRVPREALLDRYASVDDAGRYHSPIENPDRRFFTMLGTLVQGRVSVSGAALSAGKSALTIAIRHALRRRQFGPLGGDVQSAPRARGDEVPLLDYLTHQRRLLPRLARTYALHYAQRELVAEFGRSFADDYPEERQRKLETFAAGVKAASTWHATDTIQACREACGGMGYLAASRFAALRADTDVFTTFEGDNTVLLQLVAKSLLTGFREEFGELDPLGMARFVADQIVAAVVERTSARQLVERLIDAVPRSGDDAGLLNRDYHLEMLRWREEHILSGVARRLKRGIDAGQDAFEVFLICQDHVALAASAHIDRRVAEAFVSGIAEVEDDEAAAVLGRLCALHCLEVIERERGWFQEHGRLSGQRAKAVTATVNELCAQLRPSAGTLVDAFGIPDEVLGVLGQAEPAA